MDGFDAGREGVGSAPKRLVRSEAEVLCGWGVGEVIVADADSGVRRSLMRGMCSKVVSYF